jgi:hypothetical protein
LLETCAQFLILKENISPKFPNKEVSFTALLLGISNQKINPKPWEPLLVMQAQSDDLLMWHCKLSHLSFDYIQFMQKNKLVKGLEKGVFPAVNPRCEHCASGKLSVKPFLEKSLTIVTCPLQFTPLILLDLSTFLLEENTIYWSSLMPILVTHGHSI